MRDRKTNPEVRSVLIPEDLWEWLGEYAKKKGAPRSTMIRMILTEFRNKEEEQHPKEKMKEGPISPQKTSETMSIKDLANKINQMKEEGGGKGG